MNAVGLPRDFLQQVVDPDVAECFSAPAIRTAFHACTSLLSLRDWVHTSYQSTSWHFRNVAQRPFSSKSDLQKALEALEPAVAIVTDIANASKHMVLKPTMARTSLYGAANTTVTQTSSGGGIGGGPIGGAPIGGSVTIIGVSVDIGGSQFDVLGSVRSCHALWLGLFNDNSW